VTAEAGTIEVETIVDAIIVVTIEDQEKIIEINPNYLSKINPLNLY
jgi:hypothetical protein